MAIRLRKKKLIGAALAGSMGMLILCSAGGFVLYQKAEEREIALKKEYQAQVKELEQVASQSEVGYALKHKVKAGEPIVASDTVKVYLPEAGASEDRYMANLIDSGDTYYARTEMPAKTILTDSLLYLNELITKDMREGEYAFIELPTNIKQDDYVDIRIQFPTGDDFVLLSKKKVKTVEGLTAWFNVDEGEILTMSSAIVDAYIEKAKIYAMPYVDSHMQNASQMTYPVKTNVRELIEKSPNIVNRAKLNLEQQNRARVEMNLQAVDQSQKEQVRAGESATQSAVAEDTAKRNAEDRVNALNQATQTEAQKNLIGGTKE